MIQARNKLSDNTCRPNDRLRCIPAEAVFWASVDHLAAEHSFRCQHRIARSKLCFVEDPD